MSKYEPLGQFLKSLSRDFVPMTFREIEEILSAKLPPSKKYPAWWSNNPSNNVMTKYWLDAGYETESVDIERGKLVFRRKPRTFKTQNDLPRKSIIGCMKGMVTLPLDFNPSEPFWSDHDNWNDGIIGGLDRK
jgi:hypothetical protein